MVLLHRTVADNGESWHCNSESSNIVQLGDFASPFPHLKMNDCPLLVNTKNSYAKMISNGKQWRCVIYLRFLFSDMFRFVGPSCQSWSKASSVGAGSSPQQQSPPGPLDQPSGSWLTSWQALKGYTSRFKSMKHTTGWHLPLATQKHYFYIV